MTPDERDRAGRHGSCRCATADGVESGDVDGVVSLLTDDALLTMAPQPLEYQGDEAIAALLRRPRCAAHRANPRKQPAFGCYLPDPHAAIARPYGR